MITVSKVLVPIDFSDCSEAALRYARAFREAFGASLHLLHVIQDPYTLPWAAEAFPTPLGSMLEVWQEQARRRLETLVQDAERSETTIATVIGSPFHEIVRYASEQGIDLIVIGTHGRGALSHVLLGSVTDKVVRSAPCPVLTIRHPQHEVVV